MAESRSFGKNKKLVTGVVSHLPASREREVKARQGASRARLRLNSPGAGLRQAALVNNINPGRVSPI